MAQPPASEGKPLFPSFTKTWHSSSYDFISPTRPALSAKGRNIVITGGGTGIGNAIAIGFAQAGAKSVVVIGRRPEKLEAGVAAISAAAPGGTAVSYEVADLTDKAKTVAAFDSIAAKFGKIDVLVANAGSFADTVAIANYTGEAMMKAIELAVLPLLYSFQAFLPHAGPDPILLHTSTGLAHIAPWPNGGAYPTAKAASLKLADYIAAENSQIRVISVQPGWVPTELNGNQKEAPDTPDLPGHFYVWLASPEAAFLKSKFVWTNWDAQELIERAEEIKSSRVLTWLIEGIPM